MRFTPTILLLIVFLPILFFFHFRGVVVHDEGYVINSAQKILEGQIIYRDFHFSYTPVSAFATALSFLAFGQSLLASRIVLLLLSLVSTALIFQIATTITKKKVYGVFASSVYVAWGPSHINFSWPIMYVIPITLLIIYLILIFDKHKYGKLPFLIGLLTFAVFLSKQNFVVVLLPVITYFLTVKNRINNISSLTYGFVWSLIGFLSYLLYTDSLKPFFYDFYSFTIRKVLLNSEITTPLLLVDTPLQTLGRAFFYFILPVVSVCLFILLIYRKKYSLTFIPILTFSYYIVGMRPTSDYVHLVPLLSLCGIPIVLFINKLPYSQIKILGYALLCLLILAGFQTALYKNYYRWDIPLIENNSFVPGRLSVFTNEVHKGELEKMRGIINKYSSSGEYIFVNSYSPLIYFLFDRKNPTQYDFPGFEDASRYEKIAIYSLVGKDVKLVALTTNKAVSSIDTYVLGNYEFVDNVGPYYFYHKP